MAANGSGSSSPGRLDEVRRYIDRISQQWDESLGRLKAFVET